MLSSLRVRGFMHPCAALRVLVRLRAPVCARASWRLQSQRKQGAQSAAQAARGQKRAPDVVPPLSRQEMHKRGSVRPTKRHACPVSVLSDTKGEAGRTESRPSRTPGWSARQRDATCGPSHQHIRPVGRNPDPEGAAHRKRINKRTGPKVQLAEAGRRRTNRTRSERRRKQRRENPSSRTVPTTKPVIRPLKFGQETAVHHAHSKCGPRRTKGMGTVAQITGTHEPGNEELQLGL